MDCGVVPEEDSKVSREMYEVRGCDPVDGHEKARDQEFAQRRKLGTEAQINCRFHIALVLIDGEHEVFHGGVTRRRWTDRS